MGNNIIIDKANGMGKWLQSVKISDSLTIPGHWDTNLILKVLLQALPPNEWAGKKVLDIGASSGGLSIELARLGASVFAYEPNDTSRKQFQYCLDIIKQDQNLNIDVKPDTLFHIDRTIKYDVILFLGLVYHFRYPQLVLDYLGNFNSKYFFVSSQTYKSEDLVMRNRKEITPQFYGNDILAGYHPSRRLLKYMLLRAGFSEVKEIITPETGRDFENRCHIITNSAYFFMTKSFSVDIESSKDLYM